MNINVIHGAALKQATPCLVLGVATDQLTAPLLQKIDKALDGALSRATSAQEFSGEAQQTLLLHGNRQLAAERILLIGLGKEKDITLETLRKAGATTINQLRQRRLTDFSWIPADSPLHGLEVEAMTSAWVEGLILADYRFEQYRSPDPKRSPSLQQLTVLTERKKEQAATETAVRRAESLCRGVILSRDLVNEPGNVKSPIFLAEQAQAIAAEVGLECTVLDRQALEKEGCGALLGVAQGSVREPRLIVLHYRGAGDERPVALVGKGVVFDSGGISLKPGEKMDQMKMDMAGGATVLGTMLAAALLKLPVNLVGIVPAVENMPSGSAIRPGDILTSMAGRTIEVLNTDAEGRLILADALTYAKRFNPREVIDLATLTGACIIALGHHAAAVLGNHNGLLRQLQKAGETSGERCWQLPLWDEYAEQLKSEVADLKNIGGRPAGTITAAAFLQHFAKDYRWAHLDIAGTAWQEKGSDYRPAGGTGFGVRLLIEHLTRSLD
ncbi:leucyl aminopeptidase [Syntrophotalea acetylenivorans]|uniref:Probable cytosol aminopeptidase n=1 Tax=Syntrophotalea acetylenivorans TaxID=1842532 RepID=A0A1L3GPZ5_9BACT|nr:leucyl aminopeptidase [Syntrophotalea acetylenivorans]APG28009.1 leucyl aminopeptidase [Syntrophotalea acetylenivorans]